MIPEVYLKKGKDAPVLRRHPWIFSGAVSHTIASPKDGDFVSVKNSNGEPLASGFYSDSSIMVKLVGFGSETKLEVKALLTKKIADAIDYRARLGLLSSKEITGFRLINGEGDSLPGLIVDRYEDCIVIQCHSLGMHRQLSLLTEVLDELLKPRVIVSKSKDTLSDVSKENYILKGDEHGEVTFWENGVKYFVDPIRGQKTGFFLDQRDNRKFVSDLSRDRSVLNLFCYSGGFSLACSAKGAREVTSVDGSEVALNQFAKSISYNCGQKNHKLIQADCFDFLASEKSMFDLVIVDPPAFSKSRDRVKEALRGYQRLNELAIKRVAPNGVVATFSCSQVVSREQFESSIRASAINVGRSCRVIARLSQAVCHPVNIFHDEGEYLKGLVLKFD